jgi:hypothetical protein
MMGDHVEEEAKDPYLGRLKGRNALPLPFPPEHGWDPLERVNEGSGALSVKVAPYVPFVETPNE